MHKRALTIAITADFNSMTLDDIHISPFFNSKVFFSQILCKHNTSCFGKILFYNK